MKIVAVLLLLLVQASSGKPSRKYQSYGGRNPYYRPPNYFPPFPTNFPPFPTTTQSTTSQPMTTPNIMMVSEEDDKKASEFGIKIPPHECIISWDQFKENVPGKQYAEIYDIDFDDNRFPGGIKKAQLQFSIVNDSSIRREASLRVEALDMCLYIFGIEERVDPNKAIFEPLSGNALVFPGRRDFVVSSDPSRYIFYFFCYEYDTRKEDRCPSGIVILLLKDDREWPKGGDGIPDRQIRLNDVPWGDIEKTMKKCFLQQFVDDTNPQANYVWKGEDCAVPGSDVYKNGIMQT
ncbi:uncharacterized protein LOC123542386 [Mercenaria mercenaria]|uniref:uncharacterized protein LOC123542386 n=1 Tax=Mercenaria mercenaria TaxID=6596 RepID=UPI00234EA990|nr:uncharacterized protein LOC123542386 [Mercenaria mercenaria]